MFYVYKNTKENSEVIAEFSDKEKALSAMADFSKKESAPDVTGYAVRDYKLIEHWEGIKQ
jgi:hypothetical protein